MSQAAAAVDDFVAFLGDEGESVTLQTIATALPGSDWNRSETPTATTERAWIASYSRREVDGVRILADDLRAWLSRPTTPAPGSRLVRGSTTYQIIAASPGPSGVDSGIVELQLRRVAA